MRKPSNSTTSHYLNFLKDLEYELNSFNHKNIARFPIKHSVTKAWPSFLINKKIIYKDNYGCYRWNEKIPASIKIVSQFRKEVAEKNALNKVNNNELINQQKINFNQEDKKEKSYNRKDWITINAAKEFYGKSETTMRNLVRKLKNENNAALQIGKNVNGRDIIRFNRNYLDSIYLEKQPETIIKNDVGQQLGLIRKFLKWIY
jgi:hypothetical protein